MIPKSKLPGHGWKSCNTRHQVQSRKSANRQDRAVEKRLRQDARKQIEEVTGGE